jgi:hypothetical protein
VADVMKGEDPNAGDVWRLALNIANGDDAMLIGRKLEAFGRVIKDFADNPYLDLDTEE